MFFRMVGKYGLWVLLIKLVNSGQYYSELSLECFFNAEKKQSFVISDSFLCVFITSLHLFIIFIARERHRETEREREREREKAAF